MKTDLYTKLVLTVIAIALSGITIQLTTKEAHAQSGRFLFASNGALIVTVCHPVDVPLMCADVINGGQLRVVPK